MIWSILCLVCANIIFWLKGNAKPIWGLDWSPMKWWLYTSLLTNYLSLTAWWRIVEDYGIWRASVTWGVITILVELPLNSIFYGFNWRGLVAVLLVALAALIVSTGN